MLGVMSTEESEALAARRQLERVLASSGFARNERMAQFLRFVVEQYLAGKDGELKESIIAVEVFGRRPDHDWFRRPFNMDYLITSLRFGLQTICR